MMKKLFHKIHLWLSIPIGLIIVVICLTGSILVFESEIDELANPSLYFAEEVLDAPLPLEVLVAKVNEQLEGKTVTSVQIPSDPKRNYSMSLAGGGRSSVYVDPYTGDVKGIYQRAEGFTGFMFRLHRWLLDGSRTVGKAIVGYSTLLFVIILITGFIIWWPKSQKQLRHRLKVSTKHGNRRFWFDMHTSVGFYVCIGLIVLALTGLYYSFDWYKNGLNKILGVEVTSNGNQGSAGGNGQLGNGAGPQQKGARQGKGQDQGNQARGGEQNETKTIVVEQWETVVAELRTLNPNYKTITISDGSATVSQQVKFGNSRASDRYVFDAITAEITDVQLYKDQPKASKVRGWIYTLHVGSWGGMLGKILTCLLSLTGASLALTGYYMYLVKRKKKKK